MTEPIRSTAEDASPDTELATSLRPASPDPGVDFGDDGNDDTDDTARAGYDVSAVSGDTDAVRPQ